MYEAHGEYMTVPRVTKTSRYFIKNKKNCSKINFYVEKIFLCESLTNGSVHHEIFVAKRIGERRVIRVKPS